MCKVCGSARSREMFSARCLNKYMVNYYYCDICGFLQSEEPYWRNEAYAEPIAAADTGVISRNIHHSGITAVILFFLFDKGARFLDYAGGYGILTRMMRDYGFDYVWHDKFTRNLFARGFEFVESDPIHLVTAYEVFEHFEKPMQELENMLRIARNILFSTDILPDSVPQPGSWPYYGFEHGQHVGFYSFRTLEYMAGKYNLRFCSDGRRVHLFTDKAVNRHLFSALVQCSRYGLGKIIKLFLQSRTSSDRIRVIESARQNP